MLGQKLLTLRAAAACMALSVALAACNRDSATTGPTSTQPKDFAANLRLVAGDQQIGALGVALPQLLQAKVVSAGGQPVMGATVKFGVRGGGGLVAPATVLSDENGFVTAIWTMGSSPGAAKAVATLTNDFVLDSVVFTATATGSSPGQTLAIRRIRTPLLQVDTTGATIGSSDDYLAGVRDTLIVQVYDVGTGAGVGGTSVSWATQAGPDIDGFPVNSVTVTDAQGYAKTLWVLRTPTSGKAIPPSSIAKRMIATAPNLGQVEFQARVHPGRAAFVTLVASVPSPVVRASTGVTATVTDFSGNPISGASVAFAISGGGGSVTPTPVTTNNAGVATTTWTVGSTVGLNTLTATATATATPYSLVVSVAEPIRVTSVAAPPSAIVVIGTAPPASQAKGTTVALTIQVNDASGTAIPSLVVSFSASAGGAVAPESVITDASGQATVTWTLSGAASVTNTLTVTAGSVTRTFTVVGGP